MTEITIKKPELDDYPEGYGRTCIQTSEGDRYCDIPVNDAIKLADIFENTPHEKLNLTPEKFILKLSYRFYTEWCLEDEFKIRTYLDYKPKNHCRDYTGQGFSDFIEEESYFALERAVKSGLIKPLPSPRTGDEIRSKVLEGVIKRAIELFSDWGGEYHPPDWFNNEIPDDKKDKRNLRCNLREYIGF